MIVKAHFVQKIAALPKNTDMKSLSAIQLNISCSVFTRKFPPSLNICIFGESTLNLFISPLFHFTKKSKIFDSYQRCQMNALKCQIDSRMIKCHHHSKPQLEWKSTVNVVRFMIFNVCRFTIEASFFPFAHRKALWCALMWYDFYRWCQRVRGAWIKYSTSSIATYPTILSSVVNWSGKKTECGAHSWS